MMSQSSASQTRLKSGRPSASMHHCGFIETEMHKTFFHKAGGRGCIGGNKHWTGSLERRVYPLTCPKVVTRPSTCPLTSPDLGFWARLGGPLDSF